MSRDVTALEAKAKELRRDIVKMIYAAQSGHLGGSLSEIDILTALFHGEMNYSGKWMILTETDLFYQKDIQLLPYMLILLMWAVFQKKDFLIHIEESMAFYRDILV